MFELGPFYGLVMSDDPALQLEASTRHSARIAHPVPKRVPSLMKPRMPRRIRVGFFSNDYHEHPVAKLVPGLLGHLDRGRFEVVVHSYDKAGTTASGRASARPATVSST